MLKDKIKEIMSVIFNVDITSISEDSSPDSIITWDSLKHMNLILAIEEEFNLSLTDDEVVNMSDFKTVCETLEKRIVK
jgi:acyl carrier protein